MALTVEDGTGKTDADSYISVTDADTYNTNHENSSTWTAASTANKEKALRLATQYLDSNYNIRWKGARISRTQSLDWPRQNIKDSDGFWVDSAAVPQAVKDACCEMALRQLGLSSGSILLPDLTDPGTVKRYAVKVGPIEEDTTYMGGKSPLTQYTLVDDLLRDLIKPAYSITRG